MQMYTTNYLVVPGHVGVVSGCRLHLQMLHEKHWKFSYRYRREVWSLKLERYEEKQTGDNLDVKICMVRWLSLRRRGDCCENWNEWETSSWWLLPPWWRDKYWGRDVSQRSWFIILFKKFNIRATFKDRGKISAGLYLYIYSERNDCHKFKILVGMYVTRNRRSANN